MPFSLVPGLSCRVHVRWTVRIDSSVGEPFLGIWKAHVLDQIRCQQDAAHSAARARVSRLPRAPATSDKGRKRKHEGAPGVWAPPPSQNAAARLERLTKARRLLEVAEPGAVPPSASSSLAGGQSSSTEQDAGLLPPGVLT